MALQVNDLKTMELYLEGVLGRADHHAKTVGAIALAIVGAVLWKKDPEPVRVRTYAGKTANILWVRINGKRYALAYNHHNSWEPAPAVWWPLRTRPSIPRWAIAVKILVFLALIARLRGGGWCPIPPGNRAVGTSIFIDAQKDLDGSRLSRERRDAFGKSTWPISAV